MKMRLSSLLVLALLATPGYSQVFGSLANFDVVNDTGKTAHGFEIDIPNIHASDITSIFGAANRWPNMERYGSPTVTDYGTGVKIRYQASNNNGTWSAGTPSGTLPVSPSDSCWPLGAAAYGSNYPCDHFGVSTSVSTPNVTYSWLVESPGNPNSLTPVPATVPNPVWTVTPVPPIANVPQPPKVNVVIAAPQPQYYEFGEPRWVKVTATGTLKDVAVEDLVAENAVIQKAKTQTQIEWQLLQVDAGKPGSGQIDLTGVALDPGATGVVYRFEFYKYTGNRDPQTNEALVGPNGDTPGANGPSPGDLGAFIVAQNAGINFDGVIPPAPPLPIAPALNATISGATVGSPYNQVIDATPGNAGDTLSFTVVGLPAGLSFDNASHAIVGTPTVVGSFPLTITVTDTNNGMSTTGTTSIDVADAAIVFNLSFNQGTVGVPYSQQLSVTGGYGAITYTANGALPDGLSLVGDLISGTPTTAGSTPVTIIAADALGYTQVATSTLTVADAPVVAPPPPPPGPAACSGTNKVISSAGNVSFDIAGGIANGGQSVNYAPAANTSFVAPLTAAGGIKAGMLATYAGSVDANGFCAATSMTIAPGLSLNPISLPTGAVGSAYPATAVTPTGGVSPYTISVSGLPTGLVFDGTNITGTPAAGTAGNATVSIAVNDNIGETVISTQTLTINPPPAITGATANLPANGVYGAAYSGSATAAGGTGTLTWSASGLPAGLSITSAGVVAGTPTALGTFPIVLTATDSVGQTATVNASVTVTAPAVTITSSSIPATGTVGVAYSATEQASGGYGGLTWSATGLPAGVSISPTGAVSGTPTTAATYNVVLTVKDSLGTAATASGTVVIAAAPAPAAEPSCAKPAKSASKREGEGRITAINGNAVTFKTKKGVLVTVTVPACAKIEWEHGAKAFALGQAFEWKGYYSAATGNVAQSVSID